MPAALQIAIADTDPLKILIFERWVIRQRPCPVVETALQCRSFAGWCFCSTDTRNLSGQPRPRKNGAEE